MQQYALLKISFGNTQFEAICKAPSARRATDISLPPTSIHLQQLFLLNGNTTLRKSPCQCIFHKGDMNSCLKLLWCKNGHNKWRSIPSLFQQILQIDYEFTITSDWLENSLLTFGIIAGDRYSRHLYANRNLHTAFDEMKITINQQYLLCTIIVTADNSHAVS